MKGYQALAKKIVFDFQDAFDIFKNQSTTYGALKRLEKQGLIKKVRNNLYVLIDPTTQSAYASKYQIGSSIHDDAYISHLSALEYYGVINQVTRMCYVSSPKRFNTFEFEDITYLHVPNKQHIGIIAPPYSNKVSITDIEKTIIDSIHALDHVMNLEAIIYSLEMISSLDEDKLITYLKAYNIQTLYQKTGYLLSLFKDQLRLSLTFFDVIYQHINHGVIYLSEDAKKEGKYMPSFQVVVPRHLVEKAEYDDI